MKEIIKKRLCPFCTKENNKNCESIEIIAKRQYKQYKCLNYNLDINKICPPIDIHYNIKSNYEKNKILSKD